MIQASGWEDFQIKGLADNHYIGIAKIAAVRSQEAEVEVANTGFLTLLGYTARDLEDGAQMSFYPLLLEYEEVRDFFQHQFCPGQSYRTAYHLLTKGGRAVWVVDNGYFFIDEEGKECAQTILTPMAEIGQEEKELVESRERLRTGLRYSKTCVFEVDLTQQLYTHFENAEGIFGVSEQKILQDVKRFQALSTEEYQAAAAEYFSHPDDADVIADAFAHINSGIPVTYEARMKAGNTKFLWCKVDAMPILRDGIPVRMIGVVTNIDHMKAETEKFKRQATRDTFTGFLNKKSTQGAVEKLLGKSPSSGYALLVFDLDNLKQINDTRGHNTGDEAISVVAKRLKRAFDQDAIIGRFGGDEFVVFTRYWRCRQEVLRKARSVLHIEGDIAIKTSAGAAFYPEDGRDFTTLFSKADAALYRAKESGGACEAFNMVCEKQENGFA